MLRKVKMKVDTKDLKPDDFITGSEERWEIMVPPPGMLVVKVEVNKQGGILLWLGKAEAPELWNEYYSWAIERMEEVTDE